MQIPEFVIYSDDLVFRLVRLTNDELESFQKNQEPKPESESMAVATFNCPRCDHAMTIFVG